MNDDPPPSDSIPTADNISKSKDEPASDHAHMHAQLHIENVFLEIQVLPLAISKFSQLASYSDTPPLNWLLSHIHQVCVYLKLASAQLDLSIVDDERMSQLHGDYLNDFTTTDVMTFDLQEASDTVEEVDEIEGEIVVCLNQALRESDLRHHHWQHEILLYFIHGILHLLGHDDHDPEDYQHMHAIEDKILAHLGIGPVFNRQNPDENQSSLS